jgi:tetratricopeptide (TPR) repeat protein
MTSQISNRVIALLFSALLSVQSFMAQTSSMEALVGQSLSQLQNPTAESYVNCVAQLQRVEAMYPDSVLPTYQLALQSLVFVVQYPADEQAERMLHEAEQRIARLKEMQDVDPSDLHTLQGFYYTDLIVRNPALGATYYRDALEHFDKALRLNPDNLLAKQLQEKFIANMTANKV